MEFCIVSALQTCLILGITFFTHFNWKESEHMLKATYCKDLPAAATIQLICL